MGRYNRTKELTNHHKEGTTMKTSYLVYKFHKNGHIYTIMAENRTMARWNVELAHHVDLSGAKYQELRKGTVIRSGIEK